MEKSSTANTVGLAIWLGSMSLLGIGFYAKNPALMMYGLVGIGFCCFPFALDKHLRKGGTLLGFFATFGGIVATLSVVMQLWFLSLMAQLAAPGLH